ncbi:MAG: hypothetical protein VB137_04155 [Burkholderia sp.]
MAAGYRPFEQAGPYDLLHTYNILFGRAPQWHLMKAAHTEDLRAAVERITVRLPDAMIKAIDAACSKRVGNVSRNT